MKKKEKTSLHEMTPAELSKVISENQTKRREFMVNRYSKQIKNAREGRVFRRKIAVAKTVLHMKELIHE